MAMKIGIKAFIIIGLFVVISGVILAADTAGQFKVRTEKGVSIITNGRKPEPPKGAATKLVLEEIYTAGSGDSPEESFVEAVDGDIAKDGTAFVLDMKDNKVKVFDARGKFLRAFGKKGQGPGELNQPVGIFITPENEVLVSDILNQRLTVFSMEGKFLRQISTAKALGLSGIKMDGRGLIVGHSLGFGAAGKTSLDVKILDKDFNTKATLASIDVPISLQVKIDPFSATHMLYVLDGQGHLFLGSQNGYEIKVLAPDGKLLKTFGRDYVPIAITQADKDEMLKAFSIVPGINIKDRIQFPELYPPYANFVVADEGRLLVRTYEKGKAKEEFYWDVFDADGRYIAKVPIVHEIRLWRDGKAYFFVENEDGYRVLKCYRARWER
jgi:hypothetical protein